MPQSVRCQESLDGIPCQDRQIKGAFSQGLVAFLTIDEVDHIEKPSPDAFFPSSSAAIGDQSREEIGAVILANGTGSAGLRRDMWAVLLIARPSSGARRPWKKAMTLDT
jgi:hypothetical protein